MKKQTQTKPLGKFHQGSIDRSWVGPKPDPKFPKPDTCDPGRNEPKSDSGEKK